MRDANFLIETNAKPIWHPMAHPAEMRAHPPKIIMKGEGVYVTDIDGRSVLDAVGGLWNVNLGYSCDPIKQAITDQLDVLPFYSGFRGTIDRTVDRARLRTDRMVQARRHGARLLHLGRLGFGRDRAAARAAILEDQGPGRPHQIPRAEEGLSRHAFRRRLGEWQHQLPPQLRAVAAGRLPHPRAFDLSQPVRRDGSGAARQALRGAHRGRDRLPGRRHHRRLHHGAGARRRRRDRSARQLHEARARDLRPSRHPDDLGRGGHRLRPHRRLVGLAAVGRASRT